MLTYSELHCSSKFYTCLVHSTLLIKFEIKTNFLSEKWFEEKVESQMASPLREKCFDKKFNLPLQNQSLKEHFKKLPQPTNLVLKGQNSKLLYKKILCKSCKKFQANLSF